MAALFEMLIEEAMQAERRAESGGENGVAEAAISSTSSAALAREPFQGAEVVESDFLGVSMCGGRWQASFPLCLIAVGGRPCRQAPPQPQQLQAGSELEAALLRDLAVLWHGRWSTLGALPGGSTGAVPTVYNMPAKRYRYDASLTAILSELPTWAQLRAYLLQQQASSFLSAAARRYHSDSQLPDTAAWPDPDCETSSEPPQPQQHSKDQLAHEGLHTHTTGRTSEVPAPSAATAKRGRPELSVASGGGGASPGKRWRMAPLTAGLQQELQQGQEGLQRRRQRQRQRQRQGQGQAQGQRKKLKPQAFSYTGVYWAPIPKKWRAVMAFQNGAGASNFRGVSLLEASDPFVAAAARDVAVLWKVHVMGQAGKKPDGRGRGQCLGVLHAELRRNEELLRKLRGASDVPQLRTILRQLLASGWLVETSQTLRATLGQAPAVALAAFVPADAAAEAAAKAAAPAATAAAAAAEVTGAESEAVPPPRPPPSPAASGASHAAACQPPLSDELPPLALQADMAATLPAGGQHRMEGWQQLAMRQYEAWAGLVGPGDGGWLEECGLREVAQGGHAVQGDSQRQQQQQLELQLSNRRPPRTDADAVAVMSIESLASTVPFISNKVQWHNHNC